MTEDEVRLAFHHNSFQVKVLESSGMEFQDLFVRIMERAFPDHFEAVRPYGNQGDWKCDGRMLGCYYQCYAPNELTDRKVIAKINEDFNGCIQKWGNSVREWTFVHNSCNGLPPTVRKNIDQLRQANPGIAISEWNRNKLWTILESISYLKRSEVLGHVPSQNEVSSFTHAELAVIVSFLAKNQYDDTLIDDVLPIEDKILKNRLGVHSRKLIMIGVGGAPRVDAYINMHPDSSVGEEIRKTVVAKYSELRYAHPREPDLVFGAMCAFVAAGSLDAKVQGAALAVIGYFFSSCDIFEREGGWISSDTA